MKLVTVGVVDTDSARAALRWAAMRAADLGAELRVVTAVPVTVPLPPPGVPTVSLVHRDELLNTGRAVQQRILDEVFGELPAVPNVSLSVRLGDVTRVLRDEAGVADMLVLGHTRRRGRRSLVSRCRRALRCPVIAVEHDRPC